MSSIQIRPSDEPSPVVNLRWNRRRKGMISNEDQLRTLFASTPVTVLSFAPKYVIWIVVKNLGRGKLLFNLEMSTRLKPL